MRKIQEKSLASYTNRIVQQQIGRQGSHFMLTVTAVSGSRGAWFVSGTMVGETSVTGNIKCAVPGYRPSIGDLVDCAWRDNNQAYVISVISPPLAGVESTTGQSAETMTSFTGSTTFGGGCTAVDTGGNLTVCGTSTHQAGVNAPGTSGVGFQGTGGVINVSTDNASYSTLNSTTSGSNKSVLTGASGGYMTTPGFGCWMWIDCGGINGNTCINNASCSDRRIKADFRPIPDPLKRLRQLQGSLHGWSDFGRGILADCQQADNLGLVAQDVRKIVPEVVQVKTWPVFKDCASCDGDGWKRDGRGDEYKVRCPDNCNAGKVVSSTKTQKLAHVDYEHLSVLHIEATKELAAKVDAQTERIAELKAENAALEARLKAVEDKLAA